MTDQAMEGEGTAAGARATRGLNRARVIAAGALLAALASLLVMLFLFSAGGWQQGLLSIGLLGIAVALWQ
ncbi:MAG: hypothetical protein ACT60Q_26275, partial [Ferrovibrionaceae bacterium]